MRHHDWWAWVVFLMAAGVCLISLAYLAGIFVRVVYLGGYQ